MATVLGVRTSTRVQGLGSPTATPWWRKTTSSTSPSRTQSAKTTSRKSTSTSWAWTSSPSASAVAILQASTNTPQESQKILKIRFNDSTLRTIFCWKLPLILWRLYVQRLMWHLSFNCVPLTAIELDILSSGQHTNMTPKLLNTNIQNMPDTVVY